MTALTRRHLLTVGGAGVAATALAACGEEDDPREEGRDGELLEAAYAQEGLLSVAYSRATPVAGRTPPEEQEATLASFTRASKRRAGELRGLVDAAGGDTAGPGAEPSAQPTQLANGAIETYRSGSGLLSTAELRAVAIRNLAAVAAELAVLRDFAGEDPAPTAFVTGSGSEPFVAEEGN